MSLLRRLRNMIVVNQFPGAKSLICVDLRSQLFGNTSPPERRVLQASTTQTPDLMMDMIQLPSPVFTFLASPSSASKPVRIDCFPVRDGMTFWNDQDGRSYFFEVESEESGYLQSLPNLHMPKRRPLSLFVPNDEMDETFDLDHFGSTLFLMEKKPEPEPIWNMQPSYQYEAVVFGSPAIRWKTWVSQLFPAPPFVREPRYWTIRPEISAYAVVGGGKHVCISADGVGSYCLDTETHTWSESGKWCLPFRGKAEYVPELNLWLGFSAKDGQLAAADLSALDSSSKPQLVRTWKLLDLPEEYWREYRDPQLVNLGSGRFCIVRYFRTVPLMTHNCDSWDYSVQDLAIFTGVEVLRPDCDAKGDKDVELQVIPHKSVYHMSNGTCIHTVF